MIFENPAELPGGLPFATKLLMLAFLWYSSSICFLCLWRKNKNAPPAKAPTRTIPTTTPAMIPVGLAFDDFLSAAAESAAACAEAVTVMIVLPTVITDGDALVVVDPVPDGADVDADDVETASVAFLILETSVTPLV